MYWNRHQHSQLNVCNCIPLFYFNFHSTTERKSSHRYLPVTSLLTTSSESLVPPVPESAQLPYKVCLQLGLGARQDRKKRLYFHRKIQGFDLIAFSFITDNRRRFCWATYSSWGFSCVPWLKREDSVVMGWAPQGAKKSCRPCTYRLTGLAKQCLGVFATDCSARHSSVEAEVFPRMQGWSLWRGWQRESRGGVLPAKARLVWHGRPAANWRAGNERYSAHSPTKARRVPTEAIQPWCKHRFWSLGTQNSSFSAAAGDVLATAVAALLPPPCDFQRCSPWP